MYWHTLNTGLHIWAGEQRISPEPPQLQSKNSREVKNAMIFHIDLKYNDWSKEPMLLLAKWFYWEYLSYLQHIHCCNKKSFQLISAFLAPNSSLTLLLSWLASRSVFFFVLHVKYFVNINNEQIFHAFWLKSEIIHPM